MTPGGFRLPALQYLSALAIALPTVLFALYVGFFRLFWKSFFELIGLFRAGTANAAMRAQKIFILGDVGKRLRTWSTMDKFIGWIVTRALFLLSIPSILAIGLVVLVLGQCLWVIVALLLIVFGMSFKFFALERFNSFYRWWMFLEETEESPTHILNAGVLFELALESIPETVIIIINEILKPSEDRWSPLAIIEVAGSAVRHSPEHCALTPLSFACALMVAVCGRARALADRS